MDKSAMKLPLLPRSLWRKLYINLLLLYQSQVCLPYCLPRQENAHLMTPPFVWCPPRK